MADFTARFTSGATLVPWNDPPTSSLPSRLNPTTGIPHRRYLATVGTPVTFKATPDSTGVEGEIDANLGGRLFSVDMIEFPFTGKPPNTFTGGITSVQTFTPSGVGHHTIQMIREDGGSQILHIDAQAA
jgi:hypothetical protein